jgi:hypothetical protein
MCVHSPGEPGRPGAHEENPGVASLLGESAEPLEGDSIMTLVLLTAVSVWALMVLMNALNPGWGFLVESTIAVLGGAAIGFFGAWFLRRRNRKAR